MRKEFLDMKVRFLMTLIVMIAIFLSLMPLKNWVVELLEKNESVINRYVGSNFVKELKDWSFYIYSQWFGKNFGQLVPIIGIIFAFPLFSREVENGTIEFLLTRNTRGKVFLSKLIVSSSLLIGTILLLCILPMIYTFVMSIRFNPKYVPILTLHVLVGAVLWYSITLFFSVAFSDQVKSILSSFAVLAITTVIGIVKYTKFMNTYSYIMGIKNAHALGISYLMASLFLVYSSWVIFKRREF